MLVKNFDSKASQGVSFIEGMKKNKNVE